MFFVVLFCFVFPLYRIKLKKAKSIRDKMKEAGVLEDYLKNIKYKPASEGQVVYELITNHLDVSSPAPLSRCPPVCRGICSPPASGSGRFAFSHSFLKLLV